MLKMRSILLSALGASAFMGISTAVISTVAAEPAYAQSTSAKAIVDQAISDGIVGETAAGYLALAEGSASPEIVNAMNEVNGGRKTVYTRLAREQNVQIAVIAALTGEKQLAKAKPGEKIMTKEGRWITVR